MYPLVGDINDGGGYEYMRLCICDGVYGKSPYFLLDYSVPKIALKKKVLKYTQSYHQKSCEVQTKVLPSILPPRNIHAFSA